MVSRDVCKFQKSAKFIHFAEYRVKQHFYVGCTIWLRKKSSEQVNRDLQTVVLEISAEYWLKKDSRFYGYRKSIYKEMKNVLRTSWDTL
jgi:hypothetical protein